MKQIICLCWLLCGASLYAQDTIYVDATQNCLGPNGGTYNSINVKKGVTYELSYLNGTAIFNTRDNAQMANVGVAYVDKRKMIISTIEKNKKISVVTEGNLYFFFVDDPIQNKGGINILVKEIKK